MICDTCGFDSDNLTTIQTLGAYKDIYRSNVCDSCKSEYSDDIQACANYIHSVNEEMEGNVWE